jgi:FkbM family methyltransferase
VVLDRIRDALAWRWRLATCAHYLRRTFCNGDELARSYTERTPCDRAVCLDGVVIRHPPGRTGLAQMLLEVWYDQVYTRGFYRPRPGDTVIDAGANVGLFSLWLARRHPDCRVLAFEPFDENYRLLVDNLAAAGAANVRPLRVGLAAGSGLGAMIDGGERAQDHRLTAAPADGAGGAAVPTCGFADVLALAGAGRVALFKCDIEGCERDLFERADAADLGRVVRYAVEYHEHIRPRTLELLRDRLGPTHELVVRPAPTPSYGMLYATARPA